MAYFLTMEYSSIENLIGNTPLAEAVNIETGNNTLLFKLEGNNPGGSVKDRPALSMITEAEKRGSIHPGETLIEATSGNTGIGLALCAAVKGYKLTLTMPESASLERRQVMAAYGANLILTPAEQSMEGAIDKARELAAAGKGFILDQFNNPDNPLAHYRSTGPELWNQTEGSITHFISSMGTTGTIIGCSRFLKEKNPEIKIIGVQPEEGSKIPGIKKWPTEYLPRIYNSKNINKILFISQAEAEETAKRLANTEGIFCGVSGGGAAAAAIKILKQEKNAVAAVIIPDRGDRYLSTGIFQ